MGIAAQMLLNLGLKLETVKREVLSLLGELKEESPAPTTPKLIPDIKTCNCCEKYNYCAIRSAIQDIPLRHSTCFEQPFKIWANIFTFIAGNCKNYEKEKDEQE